MQFRGVYKIFWRSKGGFARTPPAYGPVLFGLNLFSEGRTCTVKDDYTSTRVYEHVALINSVNFTIQLLQLVEIISHFRFLRHVLRFKWGLLAIPSGMAMCTEVYSLSWVTVHAEVSYIPVTDQLALKMVEQGRGRGSLVSCPDYFSHPEKIQ